MLVFKPYSKKQMKTTEIKILQKISNLSRIYALISIFFAGSGHPGGSLSSMDIITYLFKNKLKLKNIKDFKIKHRNRFILSKGHAVPALYSVLAALNLLNFKDIINLRKINSKFQGHPCRIKTPWVESSSGSLGQGFSFAIGQAIALKHLKINKKIFALIGDGEMQEGQVWEGIMLSAQLKLKNLITILDYNKLQSDDFNKNIINLEPIEKKIISFNWNVIKINGHSFSEIDYAMNKKFKNQKPTFIIANTIKGKGISYMENKPLWHGSVKINKDQIRLALEELKADNKFKKICNII